MTVPHNPSHNSVAASGRHQADSDETDAILGRVVDDTLAEMAAGLDAPPPAPQPNPPVAGKPAPEAATADDDEPMPSFSEQMSQQLGGVRGVIESSIPVTVFVVLNFLGSTFHWWSLQTALIASVTGAVLLAVYRLARKQPVRYAVNGLFGIGIGAWLAWRSGDARDFYLPGIIYTGGYACALLISVAFRRPLVGWIWSMMFDGGRGRWYQHAGLLRTFSWLTVVWAAVNFLKGGLQYGLYLTDHSNLLGVTRLALGWPPYALLLAMTIWQARKIIRSDPELAADPQTAQP